MTGYIYLYAIRTAGLDMSNFLNVYKCLLCGAMVVGQQEHSEWHAKEGLGNGGNKR